MYFNVMQKLLSGQVIYYHLINFELKPLLRGFVVKYLHHKEVTIHLSYASLSSETGIPT